MTTVKRGHVQSDPSLKPRDKIKVAYLHEVRGIAQHVLAEIFEVNPGRVNTAIQDVRKAVGLR
jgi:DNA-directed RNA polymerase specialized sigma24 family protein